MWPLSVREVLVALKSDGAFGAPFEDGQNTDGIIHGATGSARDVSASDLFVALPFVDEDAHACVEEALLRGARLALVSSAWPGLSALPEALKERCAVVPDVLNTFRRFAGLFRERIDCPVIAVFGSNGKTTTKEMLAHLLTAPGRSAVKTPGTDNGFVGLPQTLCTRALRASEPKSAVVLEIGIDAPCATIGSSKRSFGPPRRARPTQW